MEITNVETYAVEMPVRPLAEPGGVSPYMGSTDAFEEYQAGGETTGGTQTTQRTIVELQTDGDVTGWGETRTVLARGPGGPRSARTIIEEAVAPVVTGMEVGAAGAFVDDPAFRYEYIDLSPFVAPVEMAMWDAYGKALDEPVHRLLGGKQTDAVECACCLGILDLPETRRKAQEFHDMGFSVLKTKASRDWAHDVDRVAAIDDATDGGLDVRLDPNQEWTFEDAVRVGAHLEQRGLFVEYLEQPIRTDTVGTYRTLRERLRQPIGVNEDMYHKHNLFALVREDAIDVAVLELIAAGGIVPLRRLAALGAEAGISMSHHSSFDLGLKTAAKVHAIAATPAINLPMDVVYYSLADDILVDPFEIVDGAITVPDEPGLGVTVDREKLEQYAAAE